MKKRSLVAAIAMLVVSAIVLTSATYAWFATSNRADVSAISASVANGSSNLSLKATGDYAKVDPSTILGKTVLSIDDYFHGSDSITGSQKKLAATLNPVSMSYTADDAAATSPVVPPQFNKVSYNGSKYTGFTSAAEADYLTYSFDVIFDNPGGTDAYIITLTPSFVTGKENDVNPFTYGLIKVTYDSDSTATWYFVKPDSNSYTPVVGIPSVNVAAEGQPEDLQAFVNENQNPSNSILDATDTNAAGSTTNAWTAGALDGFDAANTFVKTGAITYNVAANVSNKTAHVTVYVWAEGQDPDCTGTASAVNTGFSFSCAAAIDE